MSLDKKDSLKDAKSLIQAYKTVIEVQNSEVEIKKQNLGSTFEDDKSESIRQLNEIKDASQRAKDEIKNQFDELIELFKLSIPSETDIKSKLNKFTSDAKSNVKSKIPNIPTDTKNDGIDFLLKQVLLAVQNTKSRISEIFIDEVLKTAGCSEEQLFNGNDEGGNRNNKIHIRVNQIDLKKLLTKNPVEKENSILYEKEDRSNGYLPYPMNKELFYRIQNENVSFYDEFGQDYIGESGVGILDIKYVTSYVEEGQTKYGDFFEVTLTNRLTGNNISNFLRDYYKSIDIIDFDTFVPKVLNELTNFIDISANISKTEKEEEKKFNKIIQRILGLCFDNTKEIDVSGTSKLSVLDDIDDSFFEMSFVDLRNIENETNNFTNGVIEFKDCDNIKLKVNPDSFIESVNNIRNVPDNQKVDKFIEEIENKLNDTDWKTNTSIDLNLDVSFKSDILKSIPRAAVSAILSPKVLLGMMVVLKSVGSNVADLVEDFRTFMSSMKQFMVELVSKIGSIFIEELFTLLKKNIKKLISVILLQIIRESKDTRVKIITSIVAVLLQLGSAVVDWRQCKSVVDEIINLLNISIQAINGSGSRGLPSFVLASSGLLGGYSPTRAFANVTENLQKLGLPTGPLPDGSPNIALSAIYQTLKASHDEQIKNGKTEIFVPPLTVVSLGGGTTLPTVVNGKSY
jgi:hypothetical protein